jgi:hypothetical protein
MEDLGAQISYLTLEEGTPVYVSEGREVGKVAHVLADPGADLFEGIVLGMGGLPPEHRFVDPDLIVEIHERGVVLGIDSAGVESLPEPSANPGSIGTGPEDVVPDELRDKLRRAWDRISGRE